jgi:diacylglycerol kinase
MKIQIPIFELFVMKGFIKSFGFAFRGVQFAFEGRNFRIQFVMFVVAIMAGLYLNITQNEWALLLALSGLVLGSETINTAIEQLCDLHTTAYNPKIKRIKDIMAGAVLIVSIFAFTVGIIIFSKYLF